MRFVLENILLFLLPSAVYCGYKMLRSEPGQRQGMQVLNQAPLVTLFIVGALLVAATRIYYAATNPGGLPDQHYTPPRMGKDGKIEPGHLN